jgi:hypothetical protein
MNAVRAAALDYALRGWPVLPLRGKVPRTAHGLKDASADLDVINNWWRRWPRANVGLRTGVAFDVLDIDNIDALDLLESRRPAGGSLPFDGPVVMTARGQHFYVAATGHGNRTGIVVGADWRGRDGYVVAPPSRHPSGHVYRWAAHPETLLPTVEPWIRVLVAGDASSGVTSDPSVRRATAANVAGLVRFVRGSPSGARNARLNWAAWHLARDASSGRVRDLDRACRDLYSAALAAGLGEAETQRTIRSAFKAAARGR